MYLPKIQQLDLRPEPAPEWDFPVLPARVDLWMSGGQLHDAKTADVWRAIYKQVETGLLNQPFLITWQWNLTPTWWTRFLRWL